MNRKYLIGLIVVSCFIVSGCSTSLKVSSHIPNDMPSYKEKINGNIGNVQAVSSLPDQIIKIDSQDFEVGMKNAMFASGVFGKGTKNYNIKADIKKLYYPNFGGDYYSDFEVEYKIYDEDNNLVASKTIETRGSCSFSEHFVAANRLLRSIERATEKQYGEFVEFCHTALVSRKD